MTLKTIDELVNICERQGFAFQASAEFTLSSSSPIETMFRTGDKPVIIYSRKISYDGAGLNAKLYRNATSIGGTMIESFSTNDLVQHDAQAGFYSGATIINYGEETRAPSFIFGNSSNQGQGGALQAIDEPQIIPPNSEYRFLLEGRAGSQAVASQVEWCELENISGLSNASGEWEYVGEDLLV